MNYQTRAVEELVGTIWQLLNRQRFSNADHGEAVDVAELEPGQYEARVRVHAPDGRVLMHYDIPIDVETVHPKPYANAKVHWPEKKRRDDDG